MYYATERLLKPLSHWKRRSKPLKPRGQLNEQRVNSGGATCPARDKICPKYGIHRHYKDIIRCKNPRAAYSRVKKSRTSRSEKQKLAEANELEEFETKSISAGELAGIMQVMTAVAAKVTKASVKEKASLKPS